MIVDGPESGYDGGFPNAASIEDVEASIDGILTRVVVGRPVNARGKIIELEAEVARLTEERAISVEAHEAAMAKAREEGRREFDLELSVIVDEARLKSLRDRGL
jgi:Xaa-Pro aminopeptidase